MREAGCTAAQEIAFTLANGIAYVAGGARRRPRGRRLRAAAVVLLRLPHELLRGGREVPRGAPACGRAIMKERFGAKDPRSLMLRFHTQTGGATLTAQQPENNIVRTALRGDGGRARRDAVAAHELVRRGAGPADRARRRRSRSGRSRCSATRPAWPRRVDPLGGSYYVEALTDELERPRPRLHRDGSTRWAARSPAIEAGFYQDEIHEAAFRIQRGIETGDADRRRREPVRRRGRERPSSSSGSPTEETAQQMERAPRAPRLAGPGGRGRRARRRWRRPLEGPATSCRRCGRRSGCGRRSARCPTRSARCSGSTAPPTAWPPTRLRDVDVAVIGGTGAEGSVSRCARRRPATT